MARPSSMPMARTATLDTIVIRSGPTSRITKLIHWSTIGKRQVTPHSSNRWGERNTQKRYAKSIAKYLAIARQGRKNGYIVASQNLEYWLEGSGKDRSIDWTWLRSFGSVLRAERKNQYRFWKTIREKARKLKDGEKLVFQDFWDAQIDASLMTQPRLYYASGRCTLSSRGKFTLRRTGSELTYYGTVQHHWWDIYDWHAGLAVLIPGFGKVNDADALKLENAGLGKRFGMYSFWKQDIDGWTESFFPSGQMKGGWKKQKEGLATVGEVGDWSRSDAIWASDGLLLLPGLEYPQK